MPDVRLTHDRDGRFPPRVAEAFFCVPLATLAVACAWTWLVLWMERQTGGIGGFWAKSSVQWGAPFAAGAVQFCVGVAPLMHLSAIVSRKQAVKVWLVGASFVLWGSWLAFLFGGIYGTLHAIICGIALGQATRSALVALLPLLNLIPAWVVGGALTHHLGLSDLFSTVIGVWNVLMSCEVAIWAAMARRDAPADGDCRACGYDLSGLPQGSTCPECGIVRDPA